MNSLLTILKSRFPEKLFGSPNKLEQAFHGSDEVLVMSGLSLTSHLQKEFEFKTLFEGKSFKILFRKKPFEDTLERKEFLGLLTDPDFIAICSNHGEDIDLNELFDDWKSNQEAQKTKLSRS